MTDLKNATISILKKHNLFAKKQLGQNFLVSQKALNQIIQAADLKPTDNVIEIGSGLGTVTKALAANCKHVTAIELDKEMIHVLEDELSELKNVDLINKNALKYDLPQTEYKIVANIPYYITSPLINHFLKEALIEGKTAPESITLLMQKEVAEKICAKAGKLNVLALNVQIFGDPQIMANVKPSAFHPSPKVDSCILKITSFKKPIIKSDPIKFLKITNAAFRHKRKTLNNSLKSLNKNILELLKQANIDQLTRPQHLSIPEWDKLVEVLTLNPL